MCAPQNDAHQQVQTQQQIPSKSNDTNNRTETHLYAVINDISAISNSWTISMDFLMFIFDLLFCFSFTELVCVCMCNAYIMLTPVGFFFLICLLVTLLLCCPICLHPLTRSLFFLVDPLFFHPLLFIIQFWLFFSHCHNS